MHTHKDDTGKIVKCYHYCRNMILTWQFWVGMTLGFPVEHLIWMKLWPFYLLTTWWGIG